MKRTAFLAGALTGWMAGLGVAQARYPSSPSGSGGRLYQPRRVCSCSGPSDWKYPRAIRRVDKAYLRDRTIEWRRQLPAHLQNVINSPHLLYLHYSFKSVGDDFYQPWRNKYLTVRFFTCSCGGLATSIIDITEAPTGMHYIAVGGPQTPS